MANTPEQKKSTSPFFWIIVFLALVLPVTELYLYLRGAEIPLIFPYTPRIGWTAHPGLISSDETKGVQELFWSNGQRASRFPQHKPCKKRVAVLGCSYTMGVGISDEQTFVWRLNKRFPDVTFDNLGVTGYSPYQCLMTLENAIQHTHYDRVLFCTFEDHLVRFLQPSPLWITDFSNDPLAIMPWVERKDGQNVYHPSTIRAWPGAKRWRSLFFFNQLAILINESLHPFPSDYDRNDIYVDTVSLLQEVCDQNHIEFTVIILENNFKGLPPLPANVETLDAIYPFADNGRAGDQYRVGKIRDHHPDHIINNYWGYRIAKWLSRECGY